MKNYEKEYNYIINKYLGNIEVISDTEIREDDKVEKTNILINGIEYTSYNHLSRATVFIPTNSTFNGDFDPIYYLDVDKFGFCLSILSKKDDILEMMLYTYSDESVVQEFSFDTILNCYSFLDIDNKILQSFNNNDMSIDSYISSRKYVEVFNNCDKCYNVSMGKTDNGVKQLVIGGNVEDSINSILDGKINFESVDLGNQSMLEKSDEIIEKEKQKQKVLKKQI